VTQLNLTAGGGGYTSSPTVAFSGGGGTANGLGGTIALTATNSIFSDSDQVLNVLPNLATRSTTTPNFAPDDTPVQGQYCNGARIPPEQCGTSQGANHPGMCKGYFTPAGQSETVGVAPVFVFNGISASATVDEGNNWINMTYGPLTLSRPPASTAGSTVSAEPTVASAAVGVAQGAYSINGESAAVGGGNPNAPGTPSQDFYGQARPTTGVSIGAVEYIPPPPELLGISPAAGGAGTSAPLRLAATNLTARSTVLSARSTVTIVPVTLTGTHFTRGSIVKVAGGGVTVSGITRVSKTQLTANFAIAATAAPGGRNVTVATSGGTTSAVTFTVLAPPPPTLTAISPASSSPPANGTKIVNVTLTGTRLTGSTVSLSGTGVVVSNVVVNAAGTQITARFTISANALAGNRTVTATTSTGTSGAVTFTLLSPPTLTSISCSAIAGLLNGCASTTSAYRGDSVTVTLVGTGLTAGSVTVTPAGLLGTGITVSNVQVNASGTQLTATFAITVFTAPGTKQVRVTTPQGSSGTKPFSIVSPRAPTFTQISPASGAHGTAVNVTLTGSGFTQTGMQVALSGIGVGVSNVTTTSATTLTATFTSQTTAAIGSRRVRVFNPAGMTTAGPAAPTFIVN
jgi:hypothetical protein